MRVKTSFIDAQTPPTTPMNGYIIGKAKRLNKNINTSIQPVLPVLNNQLKKRKSFIRNKINNNNSNNYHHSMSSSLTSSNDLISTNLLIGDVILAGNIVGIVKYLGPIYLSNKQKTKEYYIGMECMSEYASKTYTCHNGLYKNHKYFNTDGNKNTGILIPFKRLTNKILPSQLLKLIHKQYQITNHLKNENKLLKLNLKLLLQNYSDDKNISGNNNDINNDNNNINSNNINDNIINDINKNLNYNSDNNSSDDDDDSSMLDSQDTEHNYDININTQYNHKPFIQTIQPNYRHHSNHSNHSHHHSVYIPSPHTLRQNINYPSPVTPPQQYIYYQPTIIPSMVAKFKPNIMPINTHVTSTHHVKYPVYENAPPRSIPVKHRNNNGHNYSKKKEIYKDNDKNKTENNDLSGLKIKLNTRKSDASKFSSFTNISTKARHAKNTESLTVNYFHDNIIGHELDANISDNNTFDNNILTDHSRPFGGFKGTKSK